MTTVLEPTLTVIIFGADEEPYSSGFGKPIFAPGTVQNTSFEPRTKVYKSITIRTGDNVSSSKCACTRV